MILLQQSHIYTQCSSDSRYQSYWLVLKLLKFWLLSKKHISLNIKYVRQLTTLWLSAFDKLNIPKNTARKTMLKVITKKTGQKFSKAIHLKPSYLIRIACYQPQK